MVGKIAQQKIAYGLSQCRRDRRDLDDQDNNDLKKSILIKSVVKVCIPSALEDHQDVVMTKHH